MPKQSSYHQTSLLAAGVMAAVILVAPLVVDAHHGWGGYLRDDFELTGSVDRPVSTAGPHASMKPCGTSCWRRRGARCELACTRASSPLVPS